MRIKSKKKRKTFMAIVLTFVSGYIDVLGLFAIGGMFLSFMSGNTTRLGLHIARGNFSAAFPFIVIIAFFVFGAFIGNILKEKIQKEVLVVILVSEVLLMIFSLLLHIANIQWTAFIPLTIAMGLQNSAQIEVNNIVIGKTFVSGTLYALGVSLSQIFQKKEKISTSIILLCSWLASLFGSIIGAVIFFHVGLTTTLLIVISFLSILLIWIIYLEVRDKETFIDIT